MRIIAIANQKGGVGKTTTTVNLAAMLADKGHKVLLIDLDPQAHLTAFMGITPEQLAGKSAYAVLTGASSLQDALLPVRDNIKLLSSELDLVAAEQELVTKVGRETILRNAINNYPKKCDYILIDCPPSLGILTLNALTAAREVIITLQPHFLSLQGLSQLLETVLLVHNRINPTLYVSGLLFCMYDSRAALTQEIVNDVTGFFENQREHTSPWQNIKIFNTRIRRNVKLAESPSYGRTILEYDTRCHGTEDYQLLAEEILAMEKSASHTQKTDACTSTPPVSASASVAAPASVTPETTFTHKTASNPNDITENNTVATSTAATDSKISDTTNIISCNTTTNNTIVHDNTTDNTAVHNSNIAQPEISATTIPPVPAAPATEPVTQAVVPTPPAITPNLTTALTSNNSEPPATDTPLQDTDSNKTSTPATNRNTE